MPLHNPLWEVAEPYLRAVGYTPADPTYGRYLLPAHPPHRALIDDPDVKHTYRRAFLKPEWKFATWEEAYTTTEIVHSEEVQITPEEIASGVEQGGRWLFYSVWERTKPPPGGWEADGRGKGHDLLLVHGLSDYGLRYAPHIPHFLRAGFRVITPDLPSYGRSTGVNSYIPSIFMMPAAVHTVIKDLGTWDAPRPVFLTGASMGGWTVLDYAHKYKSRVVGAFILCPMVEGRQESRPPKVVEIVGRGIRSVAGVFPAVAGVRGNVSDDPRVEEDFFADPLCYHGRLRIGTGLSLLDGMNDLQSHAEDIQIPIRIVHGTADRATDAHATERLFARIGSTDKQLKLYDGYEHVMLKVGIDAADDEKRQRVLTDWRDWMIERTTTE